jgi:hypothetical protein
MTTRLEALARQREYERCSLPYGLWTCADGTEVLFNRHYEPLWERANGVVTDISGGAWVPHQTEKFFYTDSDRRSLRAMRRKLTDVLTAFKSGQDVRRWVLP